MVPTMARGPLMLSPRLMLTMVLTVLDMAMVVSMEDMDTVPMVPTPMPMVPTTARGLLMLSPRLMPTMVLMVLDGYGGLYGGYGYRAYGAYPYAYGVYGK